MFGVKLPKLHDQHDYWKHRGEVYMDEITSSGYLEREGFFQDLIVYEMKDVDFQSSFEAGCGFGWNIRRIKEEFPGKKVAGLDFSFTQLKNSARYMEGFDIPVINGDNCLMPFKNGSFDIGFSLGVFIIYILKR
jgi:SAM-dependent methyltransferase